MKLLGIILLLPLIFLIVLGVVVFLSEAYHGNETARMYFWTYLGIILFVILPLFGFYLLTN
jgi:hypothetical protein